MADAFVSINPAAVRELLDDPAGPVAGLLRELSARAASVARAVVHVRRSPSRSPLSTAYPPGWTLTSIREDMYESPEGEIYGGVAAEFYPTIFLEYPAEQMHDQYPFLSTGVDSLQGLL